MESVKYFFIVLLFSFLACADKTSSNVAVVQTEELNKGDYNQSKFISSSRGEVSLNAYLPASWSMEHKEEYPVIFLLHGQGGSENSFLNTFPAKNLNEWIRNDSIPEMVIVGINGGYPSRDMQWFSEENETMITDDLEGELRQFCSKKFNTSLDASKISLLGHSRGATGALFFALEHPHKFASVVSVAFVSDYALSVLKIAANENIEDILTSQIKIEMLIGSEDNYMLRDGRKGSFIMSQLFHDLGISHEFHVIDGKSHDHFELLEYPTNLNYLQFIARSWE